MVKKFMLFLKKTPFHTYIVFILVLIISYFYASHLRLENYTLKEFNHYNGTVSAPPEIVEIESTKRSASDYEIYFQLINIDRDFFIFKPIREHVLMYENTLSNAKYIEVWSLPYSPINSSQLVFQLRIDDKIYFTIEDTKLKIEGNKYMYLFLLIFGICILIISYNYKHFQNIFSKKTGRQSPSSLYVNLYEERLKNKTDKELNEVLSKPKKYNSDAIKAATKILKERKKRE